MEQQTQANRQPQAPLDPPSPWSWTIGRAFGIPIRIHFTFPLLLVFLGWIEAQQSGGNVLMEVAFVLALFACVLLHELGHALTARAYRIRTADITLYPIGGVARLESMGKPAQEFWIAIAGPLVNVAIALVLAGGLLAFGQSLLPTQGGPGEFAQRVLFANVLLALFNLLPAFPMDGGRILRALLAQRMDYTRATNIASVIGRVFAVVFGIIGLVTFNFLLLIVAFFLYVGASGEAGAQRTQAALEGVKARDAMMTRFETLTHGQSLGAAADALLMGYQHDFPVMLGDTVLGVLSRDQLFQGMARYGRDTYISEVMSREFVRVAPDDDILIAMRHLASGNRAPILVFDNARLVGMITTENLGEYMMLRQMASSASK